MKFLDVPIRRPSFKELIDKVKRSFHCDAIAIFGLDQQSKQLFELSSLLNEDIEELQTKCNWMLKIIEREQKALVLDNEDNGETCSKYQSENAVEMYLPVFKEQGDVRIVAGLMFFGCRSAQDAKELYSEEFKEMVFRIHCLLISRYDAARKTEDAFRMAYLLCEIIDIKEPYLISRLFNVAFWCEKIAKEMKLAQIDIEKLMVATLMHDLGKIYIDERILNKQGKLTSQEYKAIKKRVLYSFEIAEQFKDLYEIYDIPNIILCYQERVDGMGYPYGKKGDEIPLLSKILGAAKAISSMLTTTSYSPAKTIFEVIEELKNNSDKQFDKQVADAAIAVIAGERKLSEEQLKGIGSFATLNIKIKKDEKEKNYIAWGNIRKKRGIYTFVPTVRLIDCGNFVIQNCSLYVSVNDQIIHYKPSIKSISEDKIEFTELEVQKDYNAFSLSWVLPGVIVTPTRNVYELFATTIAGDHIDFYIFNKNLEEDINEGVVKLMFEDGKKIALPGIITSSDRVDDRVLFRFKYMDIRPEDMKMVYSELFKKQIQLKNLLSRI